MSFKRNIFLAGLLLFLQFVIGCSSVRFAGSPAIIRSINTDKALRLSVGDVGRSSLSRTPGIPFPRAFMHIKVPFSEDVVKSPVIVIHSEGKIFQVKEPVSGYGLYAEWNSNAIGDIAKRSGLKKVYFADMEIFSVLGIWTYRKIHVYGE